MSDPQRPRDLPEPDTAGTAPRSPERRKGAPKMDDATLLAGLTPEQLSALVTDPELSAALSGLATAAGVATVQQMRARNGRFARAPRPDEAAMAVALFGTGVLVGTPWEPVHAMRQRDGDGGGADGSSDGGCGGGGCGGCGG